MRFLLALLLAVASFGQIVDNSTGSGSGGSGTVTSVGFTGGLISVATATTTPALTVAGTSGGIPYFSSGSTWASSGALTANALVLGGGAATTPATMASLGTTTTLLHGNAAGAPTFGAVVSADLNITTTTCTNQFLTAISAAVAGTCTAATLAGAQYANQGTTTTLLHGNAAGNPSWAAIVAADITAATITGTQIASSIALAGSPTTTTQAVSDNSTKIATTAYVDAKIANYGGAFTNAGSAIVTGVYSLPVTITKACTIVGWDLSVAASESGTATVKFLRVANGTTSPGAGNEINTNGVSLATGDHIHSTTVTDFTDTTLDAFDVVAVTLTAVTGSITGLTATFECQ